MQDVPLPTVPRMLLRVASAINEDATLPLHVPARTVNFLHQLGSHCDYSTKPLGWFLLLVRWSSLVDELVSILLPKEFRELRAELERLQLSKEDAVANQEWQRAITLRDQSHLLKDRLLRLGQGKATEVQPEHVVQAIANLGYKEAIDLTE